MKKSMITIVIGFFLVIICGLTIVFAPDTLSALFVIFQGIFLLIGFAFGIFKVNAYSSAFITGRQAILYTKMNLQTTDIWEALIRNNEIFQMEDLDKDFAKYKNLIFEKRQEPDCVILPDLEDIINEDNMSLKIWRGAVNQIPETLTGIGILGTFVGLIIGVGSIGFSSVTAAISSLQTMINGIEVAFYTSIVGIIFSIIFSILYKMYWNVLLKEMFKFLDTFHKEIIPSEDEQIKLMQAKYYATMLQRMQG